MATTLNNTATLNGQYNGIAITPQSDSVAAAIIEMAITKTASPMVWNAGELTYTVAVTNNDNALPLTNLVLTDTLDPALTTLVANSVAINNTPVPTTGYTYVPATGLLTLPVPDIAVGATSTITFRVAQV